MKRRAFKVFFFFCSFFFLAISIFLAGGRTSEGYLDQAPWGKSEAVEESSRCMTTVDGRTKLGEGSSHPG